MDWCGVYYPLKILLNNWLPYLAMNKKARKGFWLIWHIIIWRSTNEIIFNNKVRDVEEIVDEIKVLSWQ